MATLQEELEKAGIAKPDKRPPPEPAITYTAPEKDYNQEFNTDAQRMAPTVRGGRTVKARGWTPELKGRASKVKLYSLVEILEEENPLAFEELNIRLSNPGITRNIERVFTIMRLGKRVSCRDVQELLNKLCNVDVHTANVLFLIKQLLASRIGEHITVTKAAKGKAKNYQLTKLGMDIELPEFQELYPEKLGGQIMADGKQERIFTGFTDLELDVLKEKVALPEINSRWLKCLAILHMGHSVTTRDIMEIYNEHLIEGDTPPMKLASMFTLLRPLYKLPLFTKHLRVETVPDMRGKVYTLEKEGRDIPMLRWAEKYAKKKSQTARKSASTPRKPRAVAAPEPAAPQAPPVDKQQAPQPKTGGGFIPRDININIKLDLSDLFKLFGGFKA